MYQIWYAACNEFKDYPSNSAYDCDLNPLFENIYEIQPNTIQSFGLLNSHCENSDINLDDIFGWE